MEGHALQQILLHTEQDELSITKISCQYMQQFSAYYSWMPAEDSKGTAMY